MGFVSTFVCFVSVFAGFGSGFTSAVGVSAVFATSTSTLRERCDRCSKRLKICENSLPEGADDDVTCGDDVCSLEEAAAWGVDASDLLPLPLSSESCCGAPLSPIERRRRRTSLNGFLLVLADVPLDAALS